MAGGNVPQNLKGLFVSAGQKYHIPPAVLAGVASVETNLGANATTSSTGATGLMQFEPATAASLGVNAADPASAIDGAARLLNQYGYQGDPTRAIGAYNGGPGNPQYSYASQVQSEAARLAPQLAGATPTTTAGAAASSPTSSSSSGGASDLTDSLFGTTSSHSVLLYGTVWIAAIALGVWLLYTGLDRSTHGAVSRTAQTAGVVAEVAPRP